MGNTTEMLKGILEGCVLAMLDRRPSYGYDIARRLRALGFADVVEGTVYTILVRLERNGLVDVEGKPSELGPPRKFYALNASGRKGLAEFWTDWDFMASVIMDMKGK